MRNKKTNKIILIILAAIVLILPLFACSNDSKNTSEDTGKSSITVNEDGEYIIDLNSSTVGVVVGTFYDAIVKSIAPEAELVYYDTIADQTADLINGKIDVYMNFVNGYENLKEEYPSVETASCGEDIALDVAFAAPKDAANGQYFKELNQFLKDSKADGSLDEIIDGWNNDIGYHDVQAEIDALTGENGTLKLGINLAEGAPYLYVYNNGPAGMDIDIIVHFCQKYGYKLNISDMKFTGLLAAIETGKVDIAAADIGVTDERKEVMSFTEPYLSEEIVLCINTDQVEAGKNLWDRIVDGFEKTFIREDRWQLFVQGFLVTLKISFFTIFFGTILGFAIYMLCRKGGVKIDDFCNNIANLILSVPTVVMLMIFYYVIFGKIDIAGEWVAIICFVITTALGVYYELDNIAGSIDRGQYEAARAVGYSDSKAFWKVVFPQMLPVFSGEFMENTGEIIRATAIVGYIAVMDITKVSDIIRGRTFDALYPLIFSAFIYVLLEYVVFQILIVLFRRLDPKSRKSIRILEGVNVDDKY